MGLASAFGLVLPCLPPNGACLFVVGPLSFTYVPVPGLEGLVAATGLEPGRVDPAVLGLVNVAVLSLAVGLAVLGLGLDGLAVPLFLEGPAVGKKFLSQPIFF